MSSIHTSVFHLVLHCSRENTETKRQYLDSSEGRQGSSIASLHELASEAVMSKPETSQGQNRARWLPPYPAMTDREIVPRLWEAATIFDVCYTATGLGRRAKMAACPNSVCLINILPYILLERFWMTTDYRSLVCMLFITSTLWKQRATALTTQRLRYETVNTETCWLHHLHLCNTGGQ